MNTTQLNLHLEQLHPDCWGWALACCRRDAEEAGEVLQTAYARILAGQARFGGRSALRTWVFGVIRTVARERRTQRAKQERRERAALATPAEPDWSDSSDADATELIAALHTLSSRQREVLELVFYHDLTIEQASQIMGVTVGTARTHYERGKQRLRQLLTPSREAR